MTRTIWASIIWLGSVVAAATFGISPVKEASPTTTIDATPYIITAPPTTTTTTTVPFVQVVGSCPQWEAKMAEYGLPADPFSKIAYRESRCNPEAINATWDAQGNMVWSLNKNGTYDSGLFQINSGHKEHVRRVCGADALPNNLAGLRTLDCNLSMAAFLYDNGNGLGHWRATHNPDN
jgi:hypothetical protein